MHSGYNACIYNIMGVKLLLVSSVSEPWVIYPRHLCIYIIVIFFSQQKFAIDYSISMMIIISLYSVVSVYYTLFIVHAVAFIIILARGSSGTFTQQICMKLVPNLPWRRDKIITRLLSIL